MPEDSERIEALRREVAANPTSRQFYQLGELLRRDGQVEDAIMVLRQGLGSHSKYVAAWVSLGRALLDADKHAQASDALREALSNDPGNPVAWRLLGEARQGMGESEGALSAFERALDLAPGDEGLQLTVDRLRLDLKDGIFDAGENRPVMVLRDEPGAPAEAEDEAAEPAPTAGASEQDGEPGEPGAVDATAGRAGEDQVAADDQEAAADHETWEAPAGIAASDDEPSWPPDEAREGPLPAAEAWAAKDASETPYAEAEPYGTAEPETEAGPVTEAEPETEQRPGWDAGFAPEPEEDAATSTAASLDDTSPFGRPAPLETDDSEPGEHGATAGARPGSSGPVAATAEAPPQATFDDPFDLAGTAGNETGDRADVFAAPSAGADANRPAEEDVSFGEAPPEAAAPGQDFEPPAEALEPDTGSQDAEPAGGFPFDAREDEALSAAEPDETVATEDGAAAVEEAPDEAEIDTTADEVPEAAEPEPHPDQVAAEADAGTVEAAEAEPDADAWEVGDTERIAVAADEPTDESIEAEAEAGADGVEAPVDEADAPGEAASADELAEAEAEPDEVEADAIAGEIGAAALVRVAEAEAEAEPLPFTGPATVTMARLYIQQQQLDDAVTTLERVLDREPVNQEARDLLDLVRDMMEPLPDTLPPLSVKERKIAALQRWLASLTLGHGRSER